MKLPGSKSFSSSIHPSGLFRSALIFARHNVTNKAPPSWPVGSRFLGDVEPVSVPVGLAHVGGLEVGFEVVLGQLSPRHSHAPGGRFQASPLVNSRAAFGISDSSIRRTCPSHLRRRLRMMFGMSLDGAAGPCIRFLQRRSKLVRDDKSTFSGARFRKNKEGY